MLLVFSTFCLIVRCNEYCVLIHRLPERSRLYSERVECNEDCDFVEFNLNVGGPEIGIENDVQTCQSRQCFKRRPAILNHLDRNRPSDFRFQIRLRALLRSFNGSHRIIWSVQLLEFSQFLLSEAMAWIDL